MKKKTFKDYFKFPLKAYDFDICYIWTDNNQMALTYLADENLASDIGLKNATECRDNIVSIINGETKSEYTNVYVNENNIVYINDKAKLIIRGWGMLTGAGGYKLSTKKAAEIQDEFRDYIIKKLKGDED